MLKKDWIDREQFDIATAAQAEEALKELEDSIKAILKRIKVNLVDMGKALGGDLISDLKKLVKTISKSFQVDTLKKKLLGTALYGGALSEALHRLQIDLVGFEAAVIRAAAPLVQVLLPVVQSVVRVLTGLANALGHVIRVLFLGTEDAENFADSLGDATSAGKDLKRTVADFDQLNRLDDNDGAGFLSSGLKLKPLQGVWKKLADSILAYLEPLRKLDLTPAAQSLERLKKALAPITKELFAGLEWAWYNLFVPLAKWTVEELLPVFLDTLRAGLNALGRVIEELKPTFTWLWENFLQPLASWAGDQVIAYLQAIADELNGVTTQAGEGQNIVYMLITAGNTLAKTIAGLVSETLYWNTATENTHLSVSKLLAAVLGFGGPMGNATESVGGLAGVVGKLAEAFGLVDSASGTAWSSLKTIWSGAWQWLKEQLVDPAYSGLRDAINSVIGFLNSMLQGAANAVNFLSKAISQVGFDIPSWVPVVGGKGVHFQIGTVTAPQIPYLAKGAVLPANKPFMAVVGDQKHGTNVEAPLTTIQEAVALVMQDFVDSNLAGHEATVAVLREILEAVLGIELSDSILASAVERTNRKMAIVKGG